MYPLSDPSPEKLPVTNTKTLYTALGDHQLPNVDGVSELWWKRNQNPCWSVNGWMSASWTGVRMSLMNPALIAQKMAERTIDENAKPLLEMTMKEGIETVWDRYEMQQPPCKYCETGLSCSRCTMGPCRIIPPDRIRGVCGADADLIVVRNLLDTIATGSAAHSDHGRDIVETLYLVGTGKTKDYGIADPEKLRVIAKEYGIETAREKRK